MVLTVTMWVTCLRDVLDDKNWFGEIIVRGGDTYIRKILRLQLDKVVVGKPVLVAGSTTNCG